VSELDRGTRGAFGLTRLRDPIEAGFGRFARRLYAHAWWVILAAAMVVTPLALQVRHVELDTTTESLLEPDDPVRVAYDDFRERFGRDQVALVAVETEDVFDRDFLRRLRALHDDLENDVPHVDEVESLINVRDTHGEGDELIVADLFEEIPESDAELAAIAERALSSRLYVDQLLSADGRITTLLVRPNVYSGVGAVVDELAGFEEEAGAASGGPPAYLTGEENAELVAKLYEVIGRHQADDFRIMAAGFPIMTDHFMRIMMDDMARFTGLGLGVIVLALAVLFRRAAAVVLPVLISALAMICTIGIMVTLGIRLTTVTQIMPSFLLAVGVGGAVHILAIFYQATGRGESREDAIAHSMQHSGLAVAMTSLTTAGGLLSFASAEVGPIRELGIVTPIGILVALALQMVLLPALLAVFPMREPSRRRPDHRTITQRLLLRVGDLATGHPWPTVAVWTLLLLVAAFGVMRLSISHDPIRWFPEDEPLRVAMERLNDDLHGVMYIETLVETGRAGALREPEMLGRLERMQTLAQQAEYGGIYVGKAISILDVVKETHQALNENRADFYRIPQSRELLAQELLLFENSGSDDLEKLVDSQFSQARITLKVPFVDAIYYDEVLADLQRDFAGILGAEGEVTFTGEGRLMVRITSALATSLVRSYILAFVVIAPLMILLLGSIRIGLISMIPNLTPIFLTLGLMGWTGIPLEIFTLMIGSIALGLAVDDTIHFMHNFRRYYEHEGDARVAVRETLLTTGQALLFTSVVLSSGFFIYMRASMTNLVNFGLLTGTTIILAFLADILFAPALMTLYTRRRAAPAVGEVDAEAA
jgi:predicted RND superfamily exporter protein